MALLKKLPRLWVWSQGYAPSVSVPARRPASAVAETIPRIAWPPRAPSRAAARRRARYPHLMMGLIFLLILLAMLAVYAASGASRGSASAPYLQVTSLDGPTTLRQSGPAAPAGFWQAPNAQTALEQIAPVCLPVTGD